MSDVCAKNDGARPAPARAWARARRQCGGMSAGESALDGPPSCVGAIWRAAAIARRNRRAQCRPGRSPSSLPSRWSWRSCRSWKQASGWIRFAKNGPRSPDTRAHVPNLSWWCMLCSCGKRSVQVYKNRPQAPKHKPRLRHSRMARAAALIAFCAGCSDTVLTASITSVSGNTSRLDLLHRRRRSRGDGLAVVISLLAFPRRLVGGPAPKVQNLIALWLPRLSISSLVVSTRVLICCVQ